MTWLDGGFKMLRSMCPAGAEKEKRGPSLLRRICDVESCQGGQRVQRRDA